MTENICRCQCGTRIDLDQQLLEEREMWKQKYYCLQKQVSHDIATLKQNIYAECANLMQKEFTDRQSRHNQVINQRNNDIKNLNSRIIELEATTKVLQKEKEILEARYRELEGDIQYRDNALNSMKTNRIRTEKDYELRIEEELANLRKKLMQGSNEEQAKLEKQNQHLNHTLKEFERKYQTIIPNVERLKSELASKTSQLQALSERAQRAEREQKKLYDDLFAEKQAFQKNHQGCKNNIIKLSEKAESLNQELERAKKIRKEVRVEPVYIDRPVEVEKIVERIVEVEKIVKQYIEPTKDPALQDENHKLREEIDALLKELGFFQEKYRATVEDFEECLKGHQGNISKYKKEREQLARTIEEQNKELDMLHAFIEKTKNQKQQHHGEPEKIIVHVAKDGTYQKTVEKVEKTTTRNNQRNTRK